jgi:hypothetical protein
MSDDEQLRKCKGGVVKNRPEIMFLEFHDSIKGPSRCTFGASHEKMRPSQ